VNHNRIARLERLARERPCPVCGRTHPPHDPAAPVPDWERLNTKEQNELTRLIGAGMTVPCVRCGRSDFDLSRMTDDQLTRALQLLRALFGTCPALDGLAGEGTEGVRP
jgi:hypothetical protein